MYSLLSLCNFIWNGVSALPKPTMLLQMNVTVHKFHFCLDCSMNQPFLHGPNGSFPFPELLFYRHTINTVEKGMTLSNCRVLCSKDIFLK